MENISSIEADNWVEISSALRVELLKRTKDLHNYDINQLYTFASIINLSLANEKIGREYDES